MHAQKCSSCNHHIATEYGHLDILKELVQKCSIEEEKLKNAFGRTPLHLATMGGHARIVNI